MMHISKFKYDNSTNRIKRYQMLLLHWSRYITNIYTIKKNENKIEKNKKIEMNSKKEFFYEIKVKFQDGIYNVFYFNLSSLHEFVLNLFTKIDVRAILLLFDVELGKVI